MTKLAFLFMPLLLGTSLLHAQIAKDTTEKKKDFQLTFVTPLGTNGTASLNTINKVSVNILAGASRGVTGVELGGFMNIVMKDVKGIQAAGFANVALGKVNGLQCAGFSNYSGDSLHGAALSGFCNVNLGSAKGGQLAGFANINQKELTGLQGSGFTNITLGNFSGAQLAGFGNVAGKNMQGIQAAGFFNYAKKVKGVQLSFLNFADSVDGVSIGFLSFAKKGLHQVELSADELFYTNLAVRTGGYKFYNIVSAGFTSTGGNTLWNIGYGIGTSLSLAQKLRADLNVSAHHVSKGLLYNATSELYKLYLGAEYHLASKCFIAAGPTFNLYVSDTLLPEYASTYNTIAPYTMLNETSTERFNFKAWIGGKIALRFL